LNGDGVYGAIDDILDFLIPNSLLDLSHVDFAGILEGTVGNIGSTFASAELLTPNAVLQNWVVFSSMLFLLLLGLYLCVHGTMKDARDGIAHRGKKEELAKRMQKMTPDERRENLIEASIPGFIRHKDSVSEHLFLEFIHKHDIVNFFAEFSPLRPRPARGIFLVCFFLSYL
jgi:hypothetical protein